MELARYFTAPNYERALDEYAKVALAKDWRIGYKLDLYNHGKAAFDSDRNVSDKWLEFDNIYCGLRAYFQAFRNSNGPCWDSQKTFDVLSSQCSACSRTSGLTLVSPFDAQNRRLILDCLVALRGLKPTTGDYPWMAVSKFLHFYNPKLFAMYDIGVIWNELLNRVFKQDYIKFCNKNSLKAGERTAQFNVNYTWLSSDIMQNADPNLMSFFAEWFALQVKNHPDPHGVLNEVSGYYGAAFEFVAIGAASLEGANL